MEEHDRTLDLALRLLGDGRAPNPEEEARFAKRIAAKLGGQRPKREELEAILAPPFPDDHVDAESIETLDDEPDLATPVRAEGAAAADGYATEERGWEGSISRPPGEPRISEVSGSAPRSGREKSLARLASGGSTSGPTSSPTSARDDSGQAKADDSGLIDLRGLGKPANDPPAAAATAPVIAEPVAAEKKPITGFIPPSADPATSPPSTTAAHIASARRDAAPLPSTRRTRGNGLWIALGGFAAAAAVIVGVVAFPASKTASSPTAAKDNSAASGAAKKKSASPIEVVATSDQTPTTATNTDSTAEPSASASASTDVSNEDVAPTVAVIAKKPSYVSTGTSPVGTTTATAPVPTASVAPSTSASTPATGKPLKSTSLDEALGLNTPPATTTTSPIIDNLPDKPDQGDLRSAVNGKLGAANSCVKGLDGPSAVTITFSPAGTVSGVVVSSGPAKGTGAEACIKGVYASAHVPRSKLGGYGYAQLNP